MNTNYISGTPKAKNKSSFGNLNLNNHSNYIAYSAKNSNKQSINYSATVNVQKKQLNYLTLFPIQEQIMKLSNGFNSYQKTRDTSQQQQKSQASRSDLTGSFVHSSIQLFQIKRQPRHFTDKQFSISKTKNNQYQINTRPNYPSNIKEQVNILDHANHKNEYSLKKMSNTINQDIILHQLDYKKLKNNSTSQKIIPKKGMNRKSTSNTNGVKAYVKEDNKMIKETKNIKLSRTFKQDKTININVCSNGTNCENKKTIKHLDSNKDNGFITNCIQNSFVASKKNQLSIDTSTTDLSYQRDKQHIKVNRMKESHTDMKNCSYKKTTFIKKYAKCLSQYEINELKAFNYPIYYILPYEVRLKNKVEEINDINNTYSYAHFPNFIHYCQSLVKSKSYKCIDYDHLESECNNYNDEEGNYILVPNDHILYRYEIIESLGKGSFGEAIKCFDHKAKEFVCIKMIKSNRKLSIQAMSEVKILSNLKKQEEDEDNKINIVKYYSYFFFRNHLVNNFLIDYSVLCLSYSILIYMII